MQLPRNATRNLYVTLQPCENRVVHTDKTLFINLGSPTTPTKVAKALMWCAYVQLAWNTQHWMNTAEAIYVSMCHPQGLLYRFQLNLVFDIYSKIKGTKKDVSVSNYAMVRMECDILLVSNHNTRWLRPFCHWIRGCVRHGSCQDVVANNYPLSLDGIETILQSIGSQVMVCEPLRISQNLRRDSSKNSSNGILS